MSATLSIDKDREWLSMHQTLRFSSRSVWQLRIWETCTFSLMRHLLQDHQAPSSFSRSTMRLVYGTNIITLKRWEGRYFSSVEMFESKLPQRKRFTSFWLIRKHLFLNLKMWCGTLWDVHKWCLELEWSMVYLTSKISLASKSTLENTTTTLKFVSTLTTTKVHSEQISVKRWDMFWQNKPKSASVTSMISKYSNLGKSIASTITTATSRFSTWWCLKMRQRLLLQLVSCLSKKSQSSKQ